MFYVYVIKSKKSNGWKYIGSTNDLWKRLEEQNKGEVFSTKNYCPLALVYYEAYASEKDAREREKQLKHFGNAYKFLIKRITNSLTD